MTSHFIGTFGHIFMFHWVVLLLLLCGFDQPMLMILPFAALTLLDDQFEEVRTGLPTPHHVGYSSRLQFMVGYNDEQLGAREEAGDGGVAEGACLDSKQSEYDQVLLRTAVEDFESNFQEDPKQ